MTKDKSASASSSALSAKAVQAMQFAEELCRQKKLRFTTIRRLMLEAMWRIDAPIKPYDLQAYLDKTYGQKINPPTIYRTLEFLYQNGLVHKIESLNAFAACHDNQDFHEGQFVICTSCGHVEEIHEDAIMQKLAKRLELLGFSLQHQVVELRVGCIRQRCPHKKEAALRSRAKTGKAV